MMRRSIAVSSAASRKAAARTKVQQQARNLDAIERKHIMTRDEWFSLSLDLRRQWWRETDYGRLDPSPELRAKIEQALGGKL